MSEQFEKSVYQINPKELKDRMFFAEWSKFKIKHKDNDYFVYSKVKTNRAVQWQTLERAGFNLIDTNVQFEKKGELISSKARNIDINISFAETNNRNDLVDIARNNFVYSRFHIDPKIDNEVANRIKQNWVNNFFLGQRGHQMIVAFIKSKPVGFLQLIIKNEELIIDLIGVDKSAQGKGVASAMIQFSYQNVRGKIMQVGTQIGNLPSIRLYQKLGFKFSDSNYVFHYHSL